MRKFFDCGLFTYSHIDLPTSEYLKRENAYDIIVAGKNEMICMQT